MEGDSLPRFTFLLPANLVAVESRMESTGVPGRIHLSEDTANELRESGKGEWLTARCDEVSRTGSQRRCLLLGGAHILLFPLLSGGGKR